MINKVKPHLEIINRGSYKVGKTIVKLNRPTYSIENTGSLSIYSNTVPRESKLEVLKVDTVSCLLNHPNTENIGVLNFASARAPGGGFLKGRNAQEECLCFKSNLYLTLKQARPYYDANWKKGGGLATQNLIVSRKVSFMEDMDNNLIEKPVLTTVVSAPAVDMRRIDPNEIKLAKATNEERVENILKSFILAESTTIILGAFGCGVFKNNPTEMATIFKELLIDKDYIKYFDKVIFAIPGSMSKQYYNKNADLNFNSFYKVFEDYITEK